IRDPPWESQMRNHPCIILTLPPPKEQREAYEAEIIDRIENYKTQANTLVIATDGSRRKTRTHGVKKTGAGVLIQYMGKTLASVSIGLGRKTNSYDGESLALTAGMRLALRVCCEKPQITKIQFYTDSSSALSNILETKAHSSQTLSIAFIKNAKEFLQNETHQIGLQWIPSHSGHDINERADRLARRGCRKDHNILNDTL